MKKPARTSDPLGGLELSTSEVIMPDQEATRDIFLPTIARSGDRVLVIADNGSRFTLAVEDVPVLCRDLMAMAGRIAREDCFRMIDEGGVAA